EVIRGESIVKPPRGEKLPDMIQGQCIIKVGDKITTDHIMPAGTLLKHRSNVPEYAKYVFDPLNEDGQPTFAQRAQDAQREGIAGVIVAGDSYGQGSSREHAALCPMYLGVKVVIAKAIERIHQSNLVNFAILPLTFCDPAEIENIQADDKLQIDNVTETIAAGETITVKNITQNTEILCNVQLSPRQRKILAAGGLLRYTVCNDQ
ncbi:MAG TPA: aconitate hydratase, partial [Phycisphaerae bacterium]|nr:aconitate hydratase [Phycisphaerae bacterium]